MEDKLQSIMTWVNVEHPLVQILVVVAIIQVKSLKTEVEKGSMRTAIGHGWVVPKGKLNCVLFSYFLESKKYHQKGIWLIFQNDI